MIERVHVLVIAALCALPAASGHAQPENAQQENAPEENVQRAREYFERGMRLASDERWGEAVEYFRRSLSSAERAATLFNLGVALYRAGRPTEASEALERFIAVAGDGSEYGSRVAQARRHLTDMRRALARLRVTIDPPDARATIDGRSIEGTGSPRTLLLDPGAHVVAFEAPGRVLARVELSVLPGASEERTVTLVQVPVRAATLVIESIAGATIYVDGHSVGRQRAERQLPTGRRHVRVVAPGLDPFERDVTLDEGERVVIDATFRATAGTDIAAEPWLWIGVAAGVVAIAVAITLGVVLAPSDPLANYGGTANRTIAPLLAF